MGMYTKFEFDARIKAEALADTRIREVLEDLATGRRWGAPDKAPCPDIDHPFLRASRWYGVGVNCDYGWPEDGVGSSSLDGQALRLRGNLKNYDGEIELFLAWVAPYLDEEKGTELGFSHYEQDSTPTSLVLDEDPEGNPVVTSLYVAILSRRGGLT